MGIETVDTPIQLNIGQQEMAQLAILKGVIDERWPNVINGTYTDYKYLFGVMETLFDRISVWIKEKRRDDILPVGIETKIRNLDLYIESYNANRNREGTPFEISEKNLRGIIVVLFRALKMDIYQLMFDLKLTVPKREAIVSDSSNSDGIFKTIGGNRG